MTDGLPRLTTAQATARLGVQPATLYAYVSRGLITRQRAEGGGSTFDALEVEVLAARRRPQSGGAAGQPGGGDRSGGTGAPLMVIDSPLTLLLDDDLYFRGTRATDLAREASFEQAATFLWTGSLPAEAPRFAGVAGDDGRTRAAAANLGPVARAIDSLIMAVVIAGSSDPMRHDRAAESVHGAGQRMIACMIGSLPDVGAPTPSDAAVATRLWAKLSPVPPTASDLSLLNAALVLSMDHDLAVSTLAARVAASARADPYAGVIAALSAFDGPLHGSASTNAAELLAEVTASGRPEGALAAQVHAGRGTPGFGHLIYRRRDPRAAALFERMRALPRYAPVVRAVDQLSATVQQRLPRPANVDLALAALAIANDMRPAAGQIIFAVARTAGWIAHIVDEYGQAPLRMRPQARYTGVAPH